MSYTLEGLMSEDINVLCMKCPAIASTYVAMLDQIIQATKDKGRDIKNVKINGVRMDGEYRVKIGIRYA